MKQKKITIKDVAKEANVSKATVSYVLNDVDKVSGETRQRVLEAIDRLGYVPSTTARDLAKQSNVNQSEEDSSLFEDSPFYQEFMDSFIQNKVGKVSKETKKKLFKTISEWGYIPSNLFSQLIKQAKNTIAVFLDMERDFKHKILDNNPFFQELISGIEHTSQLNGFSIRIYNSNDVDLFDEVLQDQSLVGVIVINNLPRKLSLLLNKVDYPVVAIDGYEYNPNFISVISENQKGSFDSVEYLIMKGHKNIAFVGWETNKASFVKWRLDGYKLALESYGLAYAKEHVYLSDVIYSYEEGIRIAQKIIESGYKYDAIFCTSDIMAIGLMKGLIRKGYRVPEDISIMGFDNIQFSKYSNPELTTVDQNIFLKAETAVTIIKRKSEGEPVKNEYVLPVSIVERESVISKRERRE